MQNLAARKISVQSRSGEACVFYYNGVEIHAVYNLELLHLYVLKQASHCLPDKILISSLDPGQLLLATALKSALAPVIYLAHSLLDLPFGPHATFRSSVNTELIRQASGIMTVSSFFKNYLLQWAGLESSVFHFPVYGQGPFPRYSSFGEGFVTFINPCAYKGMSIFLKLVDRFSEIEFAALPSWGTTEVDHRRLTQSRNITILEPSDNIGEVLSKTRVLLVPSLLPEAFGLIAVEAMLHGIPVVASNAGGLAEAKLGIDYVLPINPIETYEPGFDSRNSSIPVLPEQNVLPWEDALCTLLNQRPQFDSISETSRAAALSFVSKIDIADFERFFREHSSMPSRDVHIHTDRRAAATEDSVNKLSREKRSLLALRALKASRDQDHD